MREFTNFFKTERVTDIELSTDFQLYLSCSSDYMMDCLGVLTDVPILTKSLTTPKSLFSNSFNDFVATVSVNQFDPLQFSFYKEPILSVGLDTATTLNTSASDLLFNAFNAQFTSKGLYIRPGTRYLISTTNSATGWEAVKYQPTPGVYLLAAKVDPDSKNAVVGVSQDLRFKVASSKRTLFELKGCTISINAPAIQMSGEELMSYDAVVTYSKIELYNED